MPKDNTVSTFKDLPKVISMQNEDNVVTMLRRIEGKLDKLLAGAASGGEDKTPDKPRLRNGHGKTMEAILQVLSDGKERHVHTLTQEVNDSGNTVVKVKETAVAASCAKLALANKIERVRKGIYQNGKAQS